MKEKDFKVGDLVEIVLPDPILGPVMVAEYKVGTKFTILEKENTAYPIWDKDGKRIQDIYTYIYRLLGEDSKEDRIGDLILDYYKDNKKQKKDGDCLCELNQIMWGGCKCGAFLREQMDI